MNEKHVTSLEISKRLKELGVKQESEFYWVPIDTHGNCQLRNLDGLYKHWSEFISSSYEFVDWKRKECYSAFLASELGEMLPEMLPVNYRFDGTPHGWLTCQRVGMWEVGYEKYDGTVMNSCDSQTEADARGKILIYLIENNILKPEEL